MQYNLNNISNSNSNSSNNNNFNKNSQVNDISNDKYIYIICKYNSLVYSTASLPLFCHLKPDKVVVFKISAKSPMITEIDSKYVLLIDKILSIMSKLFTGLRECGTIVSTNDIIENQEYKKCLQTSKQIT
jgi:hypothetical protein